MSPTHITAARRAISATRIQRTFMGVVVVVVACLAWTGPPAVAIVNGHIVAGGYATDPAPISSPYRFVGRMTYFGSDQVVCTASLIRADLALTSHHCVSGVSLDRITLTFDVLNRHRDAGLRSSVVAEYRHEEPHQDAGINMSVLKLRTPITTVKPVRLASDAGLIKKGASLTDLGWGLITRAGGCNSRKKAVDSDELREAGLTVVDAYIGGRNDHQRGMAQSRAADGIPTGGDSGGPILARESPTGGYVQVGVMQQCTANDQIFNRTGPAHDDLMNHFPPSVGDMLSPDGSVPTPRPESPPSRPPSAVTYRWHWEGQQAFGSSTLSVPADIGSMQPGQTVWIKLTARNTGDATWTSQGPDAVMVGTSRPHDRLSVFAAPGWVSPTRPARMQQSSVGPGGVATFVFPMRAPAGAAGGQLREYFNLVAGRTWMNDDNGFFIAPRVMSYQWRFEGQAAFTDASQTVAVDLEHLRPGQRVFLVVRARNTGTATWANSAPTPIVLGTSDPRDRPSSLYDPSWLTSNRPASLQQARVAPGEVGTFGFYAKAPPSAFSGDEHFGLVASGLTWLDGPGQFFRVRVIPIVGMATTPSGLGYWLVAADGGVFCFGDAQFYGSMGGKPFNGSMVGMAASPDGHGYWLVASDGGVFSFPNPGQPFYGSLGGTPPSVPITAIASSVTGHGYWLAGGNESVARFGDAGMPRENATDAVAQFVPAPSTPIADQTVQPTATQAAPVSGAALSCGQAKTRRVRCTIRLSAQITGKLRLILGTGRTQHSQTITMGKQLSKTVTITAAAAHRRSSARLTTTTGHVLASTQLR